MTRKMLICTNHSNVTHVTHARTFTCESQTRAIVFFWPVWPSVNVHTCRWYMRACHHIHYYNWLDVGGTNKKTFHGDESSRRRGWTQVADGRCSRAEEQTHPDMCGIITPRYNQQEVLRQSLTAKTPELLAMFGVIKSGPVTQELSCGLVREGSHLLVDWWNYNPGRKGEEKREKKGGREVLLWFYPAAVWKDI